MKLALMQPYFFPYIGYFHLIKSADTFVVYDDVNYIKGGWINRNKIVSSSTNNEPIYFNLPTQGASSFKRICDLKVLLNDYNKNKLFSMFKNCYGKEINYDIVISLFMSVLNCGSDNLSEVNYFGIKKISDHLNIDTDLVKTSKDLGNDNLTGPDRVIDICKKMNSSVYINTIGGKSLYNPERFSQDNISLKFIQSLPLGFPWWNLSILHLLMKFDKEDIISMLDSYTLIR
jgi:hypothetical protein